MIGRTIKPMDTAQVRAPIESRRLRDRCSFPVRLLHVRRIDFQAVSHPVRAVRTKEFRACEGATCQKENLYDSDTNR